MSVIQIRLRAYDLVRAAVSRGVEYALQREERGKEKADNDSITQKVMNELCEVIDFDEPDGVA